MQISNTYQRLDYIDIARGIGIILVVLSHSACPDLMYWANGFFMPLFYVLTGYTDKTNKVNRIVVEKKIKRLILPYLIFNIILLLVYNHHKTIDLVGVLYSRYGVFRGFEDNIYLLESGNRPLWFLTSLFTAYVLYYILICANKKRIKFLIFSYLLMAFSFRYLPILLPWSLDIAPAGALYIYLGRILREKGVVEKLTLKFLVSFIFIYAIAHFLNGPENMSAGGYGRSLVLSLICGSLGSIITLVLAKLQQSFNRVWGGVRYIGKHTLTIFCLHLPIIDKVLVCLTKMKVSNEIIISFVQLALALIIGLVLSILFKRFMPFVVGEKLY